LDAHHTSGITGGCSPHPRNFLYLPFKGQSARLAGAAATLSETHRTIAPSLVQGGFECRGDSVNIFLVDTGCIKVEANSFRFRIQLDMDNAVFSNNSLVKKFKAA
jgi:hypothetical protein